MSSTDAVWAYADDLRRYAAYLCRDAHDAEDVAQNALMKAAEAIDGFRGEASVRTWLHTIATNECRMLHRRARPDSLEVLTGAGARPTSEVPVEPEEEAIAAEQRRAVVAALERLPLRYQQVLVLKDGCGMRSAEVATLLGTTVASAKSTLHRARRNLRSQLRATMAD